MSAESPLSTEKIAFLDVETTGLSPAMGDRIIELGVITYRGSVRTLQKTWLFDPGRSIAIAARNVHGISDADVHGKPVFGDAADEVAKLLSEYWLVGHNVRFDVGFLAMELHMAGTNTAPEGCLDTCQLAAALWDSPNYRLETVVTMLNIPTSRSHRALDDAFAASAVFEHVICALGGWDAVTANDLRRLHRYLPDWPNPPDESLPPQIYDAISNGGSVLVAYTNGAGIVSERVIQPEASFAAGRFQYIRAYCQRAHEVRTFRVDRVRCINGSAQ